MRHAFHWPVHDRSRRLGRFGSRAARLWTNFVLFVIRTAIIIAVVLLMATCLYVITPVLFKDYPLEFRP